MGTRSFISKYNPDTEDYTAIYCHYDGYPNGVGLTLRNRYNTDEKVSFLLEQGDISSLYDTVVETVEKSYRTRGDKNTDAVTFKYFTDMVEHYRNMSCEYGYLWSGGLWECYALDPKEINLYELEAVNV